MGAKFTVSAALQLGTGISVTGGLEIRINTATTPIVLNDVNKTQLPSGQYLRVEGSNVTIRIDVSNPAQTADDIVLAGSLLVEQTKDASGQQRTLLAFSGVTVSLGPDFQNVLQNASGFFVLQPAGIAGQLQGTVNLPATLPFSLQGTFGFAINRTTVQVDESVTVGGQTLTLKLPAGSFTRISGTGVRLAVAGQTLTGDFAIELTTTSTLLTAKNVSISLGDGTTDVVRVTNGSGSFLIDKRVASPGLAGKLAATVALNIPGITLSGTLALELNTTGVAQNGVDAGNYLRVGATNVVLGVAGQRLKGNFFFEQTTRRAPDGTFTARVTKLAATNVSLFLGDDGGTPGDASPEIDDDLGIALSNGSAQLLITPQGIAGSFTVSFSLRGLDDFITLPGGATFSLKINTTTAAVNETFKVTGEPDLQLVLPAGPFLRAELTLPQPLTIFGQQIGGSFAFERITSAGPDKAVGTADDTQIMRIAATNVTLFLGDPGGTGTNDDIGVTVSDGTALFLVTPQGVAGRVSANATIRLLPGAGISAHVAIELNQLAGAGGAGIAVNESFAVGGQTQTLVLPAGPYLKVAVTGLQFSIAGQSLSGDITFVRSGAGGANTTISFANVGLRLGTPDRDIVVVTNGSGSFQILPGGIRGTVTATVAIDIPGVAASGTFSVQIDTTITPSSLRVTGTNVSLTVAGQTIAGDFTFEKATSGGQPVIAIAITGADDDGDGTPGAKVVLGDGTTTFLTIKNIRGAILVTNAGIAADMTAAVVLGPALAQNLTLNTGPISLVVNTTNVAVNRTFTIGANPAITLNVAAGPYLRVQIGTPTTKAKLAVFGQSIEGVFLFEQQTTKAGAKVIRIGMTGVNLFLGDPGVDGDPDAIADNAGVKFSNVTGLLLITPLGVAGSITAGGLNGGSGFQLLGLPSGFNFQANLIVEFNTLGTAVNEQFTFRDDTGAAVTRTLSVPVGPFVRVAAYNAQITLSGKTILGDFLFERSVKKGTTTPILKIGVAHLKLDDGANGIIQEAYGAFVVKPGVGVAGVFLGKAGGAGTGDGGGFSFGASIGLSINTTNQIVQETVVVNGQEIKIDLQPTPTFQFLLQDVDFDFGDILEIRGNFKLSAGNFQGDSLEVFVGSGPSRLADGSPNPKAIGVLITAASIHVKTAGAGQFAILVKGHLALVGLDGLQLSGDVEFRVNTGDATLGQNLSAGGVTRTVVPGTFSFIGTNVHFRVGTLLDLGGSIVISRQPNGTLDVALINAFVKIVVNGENLFEIGGTALFEINALTGFRMQSFKVSGFKILGDEGIAAPAPTPVDAGGTAPAPGLPPTADLASPLNGGKIVRQTFNGQGHIDVQFNDRSGSGLKTPTIIDPEQEFDVYVNGSLTPAPIVINGTPTAVAGKLNTWRYTFTGSLPTDGVVTVVFRTNGFSDQSGPGGTGVPSISEVETFFLVATPSSQPPPIAVLANPGSGTAITALDLNARRYFDVTFTSYDGKPILKSSITNNLKLKVTGSGVADLDVAATTSYLNVLGTPILITGTKADATSVTYRYFLKDKNAQNTIDLFVTGEVKVEFVRDDVAGSFFATSADATASSNGTTVATKNIPGMSQSFTLSASAPGAVPTEKPLSIGPLTLQGPSIGIADIGFADGMLVLTIAIGVDRASLAFGQAATPPGPPPATPTPQTQSGVKVDLLGVLGTFDIQVDALGLLSGNFRVNVPGKFGLRIASLEAEIPNVLQLKAEGIQVTYDPKGPVNQEIVRINSATITMPSFNITGKIRPYNTATGANIDLAEGTNQQGVIPGLVVRGNGFTIGTAELAYGLAVQPGSANALTPATSDPKIGFGDILVFDDIRVGVSNLDVTIGSEVKFNGSIYVASGGVKFLPGRPISALISDRQTADDVDSSGQQDTEAIRLQLTFAGGKVDSFQFEIDTLQVTLGSFVTLTARQVQLNTGADDDEELISFQAIGAKVKIGGLEIGGEARNFAFMGDGSFKTKTNFGIFLSVGSATGDSFQWPSFLPVRIDAIGIQWEDIEHHPEDFVLTLSASITSIAGMPGLEISGSVQGIKIQPSLLAEGKFPIIGIDAIAVRVKGDMFGGQIDAGLLGGILKLDSNYNIIGIFDTTTPVAKRVFYLGIEGGFSLAGMAGFTIRVGLSELGPLQAFISVEVPGGILLEPNTGLTINNFAAGVEFFKTLPSIEDPFALRNPEFGLPTNLSADQWLQSLQQQVALQARRLAENPGMNGFLAAFTAPMTITGSAKIYSMYTSQEVFNGQVIVKISTDGKFLIVGKLNFAGDNISLSGKLYADLSKVSSGNVTVLFLADVPDQVRILTVYGKLKMGFRNSSGQEVAFDVLEPASSSAGGSSPPAPVVAGPSSAGVIDVNTANNSLYGTKRYIDVVYTPPAGATLDHAWILSNASKVHISGSGITGATIESVVPIVMVATSDGLLDAVALTVVTVGGKKQVMRGADVVLTSDDLGGEMNDVQLLAAAMRKTGTNRFRYVLASGATFRPGDVSVSFDAEAFKNLDVTTDAGPVPGAKNSASVTLTFKVNGPTAQIVDPTNGGTIDVNVLNDRNWIDVVFLVPTIPGNTGVTLGIDAGSVLDLTPEFVLNGPGLGTIRVDDSRAPVELDPTGLTAGSKKFRFWLTGRWADTGAVALTYLASSWSWSVSETFTLGSQTLDLSTGENFLTVVFPDAANVNDASVAGGEIQIAIVDPADASATLTFNGSATFVTRFGWKVELAAVAPVKLQAGVFRYKLTITPSGTPTTSTLLLQYKFNDGTWGTGSATDNGTASDAFENPALNAAVRQTIVLSQTLPTTIRVTFPATAPLSGFALDHITITDPGSEFADVDATRSGIQLYVANGWIVSIDETRSLVRVPNTTQYDVPITVRFDPAPTAMSVTFTPALATQNGLTTGVGFTGTTTGGTQGATTVTPTDAGPSYNNRTFVDVKFAPVTGWDLDPATIGGDELDLFGVGAGNFTSTGNIPVIRVGSDTWRYMLAGDFAPGAVEVRFAEDTWRSKPPSTGPPAIGNLAFSRAFLVAGATADLVRTIPATATADEKIVALGGAAIGRDLINGLGYLEVTFRPSSGNAVDHTSINGGELELRDANGTLVPLTGAPIRVGQTDTYRYTLGAPLALGRYTVTFVGGSFGDSAGIPNQVETEEFTVVAATAALDDPVAGQVIHAGDLNGRGYVDVTFAGTSVDTKTLFDSDAEVTISSSAGHKITIDGKPLQVSGTVFRYFFTGYKSGTLTASVVAGSFKDVAGGTAATATAGTAKIDGLWIDVVFSPTPGATVDATTIDGDELTLAGAGSEALVFSSATRIDATTWRYAFTGKVSTGTITATFVAGEWSDSDGNLGTASTGSFKTIAQAQSFFIELSGGIILEAAGLTSEPLLELKAEVLLEIDTNRKVFTLTFSGQLEDHQARHRRRDGRPLRPRHGRRLQLRAAVLGRRDAGDELLGARAVRDLPVRQGHAADQHDDGDEDRDADAQGPRPERLGHHAHVHAAAAVVRARGRRPGARPPAGRRAPTWCASRAASSSASTRRSSRSTPPRSCPSAWATRS